MNQEATIPLRPTDEAGVQDPAAGPVEEEVEGGDVAAVEAARAGDRLAFAHLYRRYGPVVHGIVLARVARCEVDDLVQDIFVQALRKLPGLRDPARFGGWLSRMARNRALDHRRRSFPTAELPDDLLRTRPEEGRALSVLARIRELPEAYRETLILRFVEGLTGPEIAARVGMTPGSVRVNLHRGTRLLRELLGDASGGDR